MNDPQEKELTFDDTIRLAVDRPRSVFGTFVKGALRSIRRTQGVMNTGEIKKIIVEMKGVMPDPQKVRQYCEVCGYLPSSQYLPVTYPEVLFLHPLGALITAPEFPLSPLGLIHLSQSIIQHKQIPMDTVFDLECEMDRLTKTQRGILLDVGLKAMVDGEIVWEGLSGFISRNKETIKGKMRKHADTGFSDDVLPQKKFDVPADTGRRYAKASGDYNPHHLYPFTAKLLGYEKPIAHGMWSLARSLSFIEQEIGLSSPCAIESTFKRPIFMPAAVALFYEKSPDNNSLQFRLYDSFNGFPHVVGKISPP